MSVWMSGTQWHNHTQHMLSICASVLVVSHALLRVWYHCRAHSAFILTSRLISSAGAAKCTKVYGFLQLTGSTVDVSWRSMLIHRILP